jgi:hypothetical protein
VVEDVKADRNDCKEREEKAWLSNEVDGMAADVDVDVDVDDDATMASPSTVTTWLGVDAAADDMEKAAAAVMDGVPPAATDLEGDTGRTGVTVAAFVGRAGVAVAACVCSVSVAAVMVDKLDSDLGLGGVEEEDGEGVWAGGGVNDRGKSPSASNCNGRSRGGYFAPRTCRATVPGLLPVEFQRGAWDEADATAGAPMPPAGPAATARGEPDEARGES